MCTVSLIDWHRTMAPKRAAAAAAAAAITKTSLVGTKRTAADADDKVKTKKSKVAAKLSFPHPDAAAGTAESLPIPVPDAKTRDKIKEAEALKIYDKACRDNIERYDDVAPEAYKAAAVLRGYLVRTFPAYLKCPIGQCGEPCKVAYTVWRDDTGQIDAKEPPGMFNLVQGTLSPLRCDAGHVYWPATEVPCDFALWSKLRKETHKFNKIDGPTLDSLARYHCFGVRELEVVSLFHEALASCIGAYYRAQADAFEELSAHAEHVRLSDD
jgi:hypothetical protein